MGKSQQRKGRAGEKELCEILQNAGFDVRVGKAVSYGSEPDIVGLKGIHCEVKRCEQLRLAEWISQAVADSEKFRDGAPTIFHRRNRSEWLVTARLPDWIRFYSAYQSSKQ